MTAEEFHNLGDKFRLLRLLGKGEKRWKLKHNFTGRGLDD